MLHAIHAHWRAYLLEALGLLTFMLGAGAFGTLFMYPGSPVGQALPSDLARLAGVGACMGLVTFMIVTAIGSRTGAHINPAVTWAFWRQGKIGGWDASFYTLAQFAGAIVAPALLLLFIGEPFAHEKVMYATSQPGPGGAGVAWAAEFAISFALMLVIVLLLDSRRMAPALPAVVGVMIAVYITFVVPISGMSMNPARSLGSALTAGDWTGMWVYFTAPVLAMLLAVEAHRLLRAAVRRVAGALDEPAPNYPTERAHA
jgi:aquaporin Z